MGKMRRVKVKLRKKPSVLLSIFLLISVSHSSPLVRNLVPHPQPHPLTPYSRTPHPHNFILNLIPRFNIPKGNLSNLESLPFWEALYFSKHGNLPLQSGGGGGGGVEEEQEREVGRVKLYEELMRGSSHNNNNDEEEEESNEIQRPIQEGFDIKTSPEYQELIKHYYATTNNNDDHPNEIPYSSTSDRLGFTSKINPLQDIGSTGEMGQPQTRLLRLNLNSKDSQEDMKRGPHSRRYLHSTPLDPKTSYFDPNHHLNDAETEEEPNPIPYKPNGEIETGNANTPLETTTNIRSPSFLMRNVVLRSSPISSSRRTKMSSPDENTPILINQGIRRKFQTQGWRRRRKK